MILKEKTFNYNGHTYTVTKIENSDRFTVVRDNRNVRTISNQALQVAISNRDLGPVIERLFNDTKK